LFSSSERMVLSKVWFFLPFVFPPIIRTLRRQTRRPL
jgi:hypothetical protein